MNKKPHIQKATGFTLVELLVVILIIAALAAVAFTIAPRMKQRGQVVKNIQNMRQVGALSTMYSSENQNRLVPLRSDVQDADGNWAIGLDWPIALLGQVYPESSTKELKDRNWWRINNPFMYNPFIVNNLKSESFKPGKNGFGMNSMLGYKLIPPGSWGQPGEGGSQSKGVDISKINRPSRTVLFSTSPDYLFTNKTFTQSDSIPLIVEGKVPMMFVDMHLESVAVKTYNNDNYDYAGW